MRDPLLFPDLNHAVKRDPRTNMRDANNNWDFWTSLPEALHQVTIVMSDRGIPKSYRTMHGFGSHAFSMINKDNERVWVKFHLRSQQGIENLTDRKSTRLNSSHVANSYAVLCLKKKARTANLYASDLTPYSRAIRYIGP